MIKIKMYGKIWSPGMCACNDMCKYNKIRFKCIIAEENFVSFKYLKNTLYIHNKSGCRKEERQEKASNYQFRRKTSLKKKITGNLNFDL